MIEIYEINFERARISAVKFKAEVTLLDRVFIMEESAAAGQNCEIGIGVLGLKGGTVLIKHIVTDKPFEYYDLLARSLLSVVRDMPDIRVRISNPDAYFYRFGFKDNGGSLEILSNDINLAGTCGGKH